MHLMRIPRTVFLWTTVFALATLGSIGFDAARVSPKSRLIESLAPYVAKPDPERPIQAAVVLQKKDCTGNLRMLHLLHRASVRDRMSLVVIWYAGPVADSSFIRAALPEWTRRVPLASLTQHTYQQLQQLGHQSTPMLIVLDQHARLRFITQSPRSPRESAGLAKIIEGLTWIEEL